MAEGSGTYQQPEPKQEETLNLSKEQGQQLQDASFRDQLNDAYSNDLSNQYSVDEIKQKYASGEIPQESKDAVVMALQKRSNKATTVEGMINNAVGSMIGNVEGAGEVTKGIGEGFGALWNEGRNIVTGNPDNDGPVAGLLNTLGAATRELAVMTSGIAEEPNSADALRTILENRKATLNPDQYAQQLAIVNHVADVEKRIFQAKGDNAFAPPIAAGIGGMVGTPLGDTYMGGPQTAAPLPEGVSPMDWKSTIDLLNEDKAQSISQFDPNYAQYRQEQATNNVMAGGQTFVHGAEDLIGRGGNAIVRSIPGGSTAMDLVNRVKTPDEWSSELDNAKQFAQEGAAISKGGKPEYLPYQLPSDYKPDPQKIGAVADTIPLVLQALIPVPADEIASMLTKGFLGFGYKAVEALAVKGGVKAAAIGSKYGLYEALSSIGDASYIAATTGNMGAALGRIGAGIGTPLVSYLGGKTLSAGGKAISNLLAKTASDSWATQGVLPNLIRRGIQTPIAATAGAVPYAAMMGGTPEQFGQNVATMAGLGLAGRALPELGGAARNILFDQLHNGANWGAKGNAVPYADYGTDKAADAQSKAAISAAPQWQQNLVNGVRNFFGDRAQIHVVPTGQAWTDTMAKDAPNSDGVSARGFYVPQSNPGRIYIRSDSIPQALGWESGRLLHELMPDPIRTQFNSAAAAAMGPDKMNSTTQQYFANALGGNPAAHPTFDQLPTDEDVRNVTSGPVGIPFFSGTSNPACLAKATTLAMQQALGLFGCFAKGSSVMIPPGFTFGTMGRNFFRDSGFRNWDFSVSKNWKLGERVTAQFRAEFFNILNHPNFANPFGGQNGFGTGGFNDPSTAGAGIFGCGCATPDKAAANPVIGSGGPRATQFGLKFLF